MGLVERLQISGLTRLIDFSRDIAAEVRARPHHTHVLKIGSLQSGSTRAADILMMDAVRLGTNLLRAS